MDVALLAVRLVLAAVFTVAAVGKLADRDATRRAVEDFGLPIRSAPLVGLLLPAVELGIGAGLLITAAAPSAAVAAAALLIAFGIAIGRLLLRGEAPDCHCFGGASATPVGRGTLIRNAVLLAGAGFVAIAGSDSPGTSATAWIAHANPVALAVGAVVVLQMAFSWQLFRQNGRLLGRIEALESSAVPPADKSSSRTLARGQAAPPFALPDLEGRIVALEDLLATEEGAMLFFTDPGCGHCDPLLPLLAAEHGGRPVAVISRGAVQANRAKAAAHGLSQILIQDDFEVAGAYGVGGMPAAILVDGSGRVASGIAAGADAVLALLQTPVAPRLDLVRVEGAA